MNGRWWKATRQPSASRTSPRTPSGTSCTSTSRPGSHFEQFAKFGEIESVKAVSDLFIPLSGTVTEVNQEAVDDPELVNTDPYGGGWLIKVQIDDSAGPDNLMTAEAYEALLAESG